MEDKTGFARLQGTVSRFKGNGRKLGYPTANLDITAETKDGVYFGFTDLADYKHHPSIIFVGIPTTVGDTKRRVESYLLDIPDEDYYDLPMSVELVQYHRGNRTFKDAGELIAAMKADEAAARQWFKAAAGAVS